MQDNTPVSDAVTDSLWHERCTALQRSNDDLQQHLTQMKELIQSQLKAMEMSHEAAIEQQTQQCTQAQQQCGQLQEHCKQLQVQCQERQEQYQQLGKQHRQKQEQYEQLQDQCELYQ